MYELSLFPLETVLFPGTPIHLHIFEPRYLAMMKRCLDENRPFGVTLIRQGLEAGAGLAEPHPVGCTARIAAVDQLEDGRLNLTALGEDRFRILELNYDQPYLVAKVEGLPINGPNSLDMQRSARRLAPWVRRYLTQVNLADPESGIDLNNLQLPDDPLMLTCWAAALLQIPAYEKQPLLEAAAADDLLAGVLRLYRREATLLDYLVNVSEEEASQAALLN